MVSAQRQRLIDEVDVKEIDPDAIEDLTQQDSDSVKPGPSNEAMSRLTDYSMYQDVEERCYVQLIVHLTIVIPYINDEHADAATKNPQLKLVFRLISFFILDEGTHTIKFMV